MTVTPEGYLTGEAKVARIGIQAYQDGAGGIRREYRPPAEVFAADAIASFKNVPVTFQHPSERLVTSENAKRLGVGFVGENLRVDGEWLVMPITINDAETISQIEGGVVELSAGYVSNVIDEAGEYDGQVYDARQTQIRGNHVAIVQQARAGSDARLNLDAADAVAIKPEVKNDMADKTVTVRVDGIEYHAAPEVERHISKQAARIDTLDTELADAKTTTEKEKARADAATDELEALKATRTDEAIGKAAKARIDLERSAVKVLGDDAELEGKSDREIREAVVLAVHKDAKLTEQSDDYIAARFDAAIETHTRFDTAAAAQKQTATKREDANQREDAKSQRDKATAAMRDQWKKKESK
jgi:hypothetical protein